LKGLVESQSLIEECSNAKSVRRLTEEICIVEELGVWPVILGIQPLEMILDFLLVN